MRAFDALLIHPFTISRRARIDDGRGGAPVTYTEIGTERGRIRPASSEERQIAAQEGRQISHVLYLRGGADIGRGDQVEGAGLMVDVLAVREPSRAGHHLEIDCRERQSEAEAEMTS